MFPYICPPDPPYEQDRLQSGRPPSRLEVQQQHLDHIRFRQRNDQLSGEFRRPSVIPLVFSFRRSLGGMLISVGNWMARETGRSAAGPEVLARR